MYNNNYQQNAPQQQYGAPQQQYGAPQQQYGAPQQQYGAPQQNRPQQYAAPQNNAAPQGNGQNGGKIFYDRFTSSPFPSADHPLESLVLVFTGTITGARASVNQQGEPRMDVDVQAVLDDNTLQRYFGNSVPVGPDHVVNFRLRLSKYDGDFFAKYPPRWGQYNTFMVTRASVYSWTKKSGETGVTVSGFGSIFTQGSRKKPDGTDRKPITIFNAEIFTGNSYAPAAPAANNGYGNYPAYGNSYQGAPAAPAAAPSVANVMASGITFEEMANDDDLPF